MSAPGCEHLCIERDGGEARVCTTGAALIGLRVDGTDVVEALEGEDRCAPEQYRGSVLAPWAGRLADGVFAHDGRRYSVPVDDSQTNSALHGLVAHRRWQVASVGDGEVTLRHRLGKHPGYPFPVELEVCYRVRRGGLDATMTARNPGDVPAPFGMGVHPYFTAGTTVDATRLSVPGRVVAALDPRGQPEPAVPVESSTVDLRTPAAVGSRQLDHAFGDLTRTADGLARVTLDGGDRRVTVGLGSGVGWVMVYTSDTLPGAARRAGIAVEPMTCPPGAPDALLGTGDVIRLAWQVGVVTRA